MPTLTKGSFSLNLGIVQLGGELSDADRQYAWELYTEMSTRVAVTGYALSISICGYHAIWHR